MVAEAIKDAIPGATKVHVDLQTIRFTMVDARTGRKIRRTYLTPGKPQTALVRFDGGLLVEPFSFRLPTPMHVNELLAAKPRSPQQTRSDSPKPPRVGGRPVPVIANSTRRRFGIRGLRINQAGEVVQAGVSSSVEP
jgi:hypothetical protein